MGGTVVVADDFVPFHDLVRRIIEPEFRVVGTVTDGHELVDAAVRLAPDALIVDLQMPGLNGFEAMNALNELIPKPKVAAVFLTSYSAPSLVARAMECGVRGYVLKPMAHRHLVHALREAIGGRTFICPHARAGLS